LHVHPIDLARVEQTLEMVLESEDRRTARSAVAANSLERGRTILHGMGQDVHRGVSPANELAVAPDPLRFGDFGHVVPQVTALPTPGSPARNMGRGTGGCEFSAYSARRAWAGSILVARRAGKYAATVPTTKSKPPAAPSAIGSVGLT